jgi:hypothetical protein
MLKNILKNVCYFSFAGAGAAQRAEREARAAGATHEEKRFQVSWLDIIADIMDAINLIGNGHCFGSGSGFSQVSGFVSGIRIRIQEGQKLPTKIEKIEKFHVLKFWMFSFEG